jgi:hypothetical protein
MRSMVFKPAMLNMANMTSWRAASRCVVLQDCTVRLWESRSGRQVAFFVADAPMTGCCFAGGGAPGGVAADILVAGDAGGAVHFLDLHPNLHPDHMCM